MLQITWRPCRRLVIVFVFLLSIFGLFMNVANDRLNHPKNNKSEKIPVKTAKSVKIVNKGGIVILNPVPYNDKYCVIYDFWKTDGHYNKSITLVLHSTLKYLNYLEKHAKTWTGPISVSIFMPEPSMKIDTSILSPHLYLDILFSLLRDLKKTTKTSISIHLFYQPHKSNRSNKCSTTRIKYQYMPWNKEMTNDLPNLFMIYPINVARNIARHGLKTRLFLSGDIEQLFSDLYELKMRKLAENELLLKKRKLVLVHRRFEMDENVNVPKNKQELIELYGRGKAVEFHKHFYPMGHLVPDLQDWLEEKEDRESTRISMILNYTNAEYEPQFIGDALKIPLHDESFPFRLRSNTHLAAELCRAGFQFAIVTDLFSIHEGIKTKETSIEMAVKKVAFNSGYLNTYKKFLLKLDQKYPDTKDQCPKFLP